MDGHYYTSPNQQEYPPSSFCYSEPLPDGASPTQLRRRVWALGYFPYLPFMLRSPLLYGDMTCFATPELLPLEDDKYGFHLPSDVAESWKGVETSCLHIASVLCSSYRKRHPKVCWNFPIPPRPSNFGYFKAHSTEKKARFALSESLDAFVILLAYVSFSIAICRGSDDPLSISLSTSDLEQPRWFHILSPEVKPECLQLLVDSPVANFSSTTERVGTIINVSRCSWLYLVPYMLKANVPIWLYWGIPPFFVQPLDVGALNFAPRSHPQCRAPPLPVAASSPSLPVAASSPSLPVAASSQSLPVAASSQSLPVTASSQSLPAAASSQSVGPPVYFARKDQIPGETWQDFITRQNKRRKEKLLKENNSQRQARVGREKSAANRRVPGKKGPAVYEWKNDGGVWTRTLLSRGLVERSWGRFRSSQKIYNSIDNCWDLCVEFDAGTLGDDDEYDSNDSDSDDYRPKKKLRQSPTPEKGSSGGGLACAPILVNPMSNFVPIPAPVSSDYPPMDVDPIVPHSDSSPAPILSDRPRILVDPRDLAPQSVPSLTPPQVASDCPRMAIDSHDPTSLSFSTPAQLASQDLRHCPPMAIDPIPHSDAPILSDLPPSDTAPQSVRTPPQVAADSLSMPDTQSEGDFGGADEDEDPYDASEQHVLPALYVPLDLEEVPITKLDDLLYYRYGFSLNESPYTGIPALLKGVIRPFRSWLEVCRTVGGQQLESSAVDRVAIEDFLSILAGSVDPFKVIPGKYWDLSASGQNPIVDLPKVFISIEKKQFTLTDRASEHYIIRPRRGYLHPSRDTSWVLSVDPLTALECIRRGLGPNTIDIANFLVSHGVRFSTLEHISHSENPPVPSRPQLQVECPYLGFRPVNYVFDVPDFAGYETMRDSFLRSQPHGPLALREGGIIARLAREVLPTSNALSGPSSEALGGHHARFICDNETYVDDNFSDVELGLICGTYQLGDTNARGGIIFSFHWQLSCY
jgi:hypothetical protein